MIQIVFLSFYSILQVNSSQYNLVISDIVSTASHTWKDSNNVALAATTTICSLLKQPIVEVSGTATQTLYNTYQVNNNDHELILKVIFSGDWNNEAFLILSDTTQIASQVLSSSAWTQSFCTLTNIQTLVFKVTVPKASLITNGATMDLKLKLTIPGSGNLKNVYLGSILIYEILPDSVAITTYVENEQFNFFTSNSQSPSKIMPSFTLNTLDTLQNNHFDLLTIGGSTVNFMIGGFSIWNTGTIQFTQTLNPHYGIKFSLLVYQFDSADILNSDNFKISVIDTSGAIVVPTSNLNQVFTGDMYGSTDIDSIYYLEFETNHYSNNLVINFELSITSFVGITSFKLISKNCPQYCSTCKQQNTCSVCTSLENRNLVTCQCIQQYYEDLSDHQCKACDYRCDVCEYDGINPEGNCLICRRGFDVTQKCKTCVNTYQFENKVEVTCDNCFKCCSTCSGATDKDCITFRKGYFIMPDNQCVSACPSNYFSFVQTTSRTLCIQCDVSCKTCVDVYSKCTSCQTGYLLALNKCLRDCPISTYRFNQSCPPCADSLCQTCTESQCLLCLPNTFMSRVSKKCTTKCDNHYFGDSDTRTCKKCHQTCYQCVGQSITQCSKCQTSQYMLPIDQVNLVGVCYKVCKEGYYPSGQFCNPCYTGCLFCTSSTVCQTCVAGYYLYNNFCYEECPSKMYPNQAVQKCLKCNSSCLECSGGENNQCKSCTGALSLYQSTCYDVCPTTTISISNVCESCTNGCDICTGTNANDCTTCSLTYYILNGQCFQVCPISYQANFKTQACEYCIAHCETCIANNCKLCENGYFFSDGLCNTTCVSNFYKSMNDRKCKECDYTCATCSGPSEEDCLTCYGSYYLFSNSCQPVCPSQYYGDVQKICHQCDNSCLECNGPSNKNCTECDDTTYLYQSQCFSTCPDRTYGNDYSQTCLPCHSSCLTCQGGTENDCLTCPVYIERLKCVTACSVNFTLDANHIQCEADFQISLTCSPQCATCSLQPQNCNTCVASRNQNKPQCACKKGFFDVQQPDCETCLNKCQTCAGTADSCLTCKGNRYGADCDCPDYYYEDGVSEKCPRCNFKCKLCNNNVCTTCADRRINAPTCDCPDGYYDNLTAACQPCDLSCLTCKDFAENCLTCSTIRINPPFCVCPTKFFDFQSQCVACPFECDNCDSDGCSTCNGNMSGPFKGKCICKDGYSRKSIGSFYCTNCDLGVPYAIILTGLQKISVDFGGPLVLTTLNQSGCDKFFQASTLSTLGTSPTCALQNNAIMITLGKYSTIQIGHTFSFNNGFKLKGCANTFPSFRPVQLIVDPKTSDELNSPTITFSSLSAQTVCDDIQIKFSLGNTGSRNLQTYQWLTTMPANYVNPQLAAVLSGVTPAKTYDTSVTIPKLILSQFTTFQFTVEMKNFLNLEGSNVVYLQILGPAKIVLLQQESTTTFHRYEKAIINYTVNYQNCTMNGIEQDTLITQIQSNKKVLKQFEQEIDLEMNGLYQYSEVIDEFLLNVGTNNITLTLSMPNQGIVLTEYIIQEISEGTLIVKIFGGNRQVGDTSIINMTATVQDQDVGPLETDSFHYVISWSCLDVLKGDDCLDPYGKLLKYPNGNSIIVYASSLQQYNSYIFIASTQKGSKKSSGKSMIQVVEVDLPQLNTANTTVEAETIKTIYNYYDDIQLSFQYETSNPDNLFYSATILYDQTAQTSFQFYSLTFKFKLLDYFTDLDIVRGNQITLRASIYNPSYVMPSLRNIILTFNLPPRNCKIILNNGNEKIIEFSTLVSMTVDQCEDEDQPLQYKVLFYNSQSVYENDKFNGRFQNNIRLLDYQTDNTLLYTVPYVGFATSNSYTSLVVILIKDNQQGISNITYPINVYQNNKISQEQLFKMIDHNDDLDSTIQAQDLVISKLLSSTNYSEFKYSLIRKNDLLSTSDLTIEQQNSLFSQMTKLINDDEVAKQFDVNLQFLSYYEEMSNQNYEALQQLQSQSKSTLEQAVYLDNYFKTFDLFSALLLNSQYFNNTNDQVLDNLDIMKDQLIDFTVMNSDGFNMTNSNSQQIIKKASYKILNSIAGNILKEETVFRLLSDSTDQGSYEYYYNIFYVNPYLNEAKFPKADYFGAEVVYLRVVDEATQQVPVMLQPFTYTFNISKNFAQNKTMCIQRVYNNWSIYQIETTIINVTAVQCKTYNFFPFTLIFNRTKNNTTTTQNTSDISINNTNTNNNSQTNNTNDSSDDELSANDELKDSYSRSASQPFFVYIILLGIIILLLAFYASYRDNHFSKVHQINQPLEEVIMSNFKDDGRYSKKLDEQYSVKEQSPHLEQNLQASENSSIKKKIQIIVLNFHQLISIFYRDQGSRKLTFFYYVLRFLLIQSSIFIGYIYSDAAEDFRNIAAGVIVILLFSPLVFSFQSFFLNYPTQNQTKQILKLILVIVILTLVILCMVRISQFIENTQNSLDLITYILIGSIVYDNLIYNPIVLMITFIVMQYNKKFEMWVLGFIPKDAKDQYAQEQDEVRS